MRTAESFSEETVQQAGEKPPVPAGAVVLVTSGVV
jgi:hypothetical protein